VFRGVGPNRVTKLWAHVRVDPEAVQRVPWNPRCGAKIIACNKSRWDRCGLV